MPSELTQGQHVPATSEARACGPMTRRIRRSDPDFDALLVTNDNPAIVFKNEERSGADRIMTPRLKEKLDDLAIRVANEWAEVKLRVTEAWDESSEHAGSSLHYEGRAADLTTAPVDGRKLGRLSGLAVDAGFDWVFFEDSLHVHVSVKK